MVDRDRRSSCFASACRCQLEQPEQTVELRHLLMTLVGAAARKTPKLFCKRGTGIAGAAAVAAGADKAGQDQKTPAKQGD